MSGFAEPPDGAAVLLVPEPSLPASASAADAV